MAASAGASSSQDVAAGPPVITGTPLPAFTGTADDPAIGMAAPAVQGSDQQGAPVAIEPNGRVQMVIFAAHWCPHCQREIPIIQDWVDGGGLPDDVDIVTVSTGDRAHRAELSAGRLVRARGLDSADHRRTRPARSPRPTVSRAIRTSSSSTAAGNVFARFVGEIPIDELERILATVPRT